MHLIALRRGWKRVLAAGVAVAMTGSVEAQQAGSDWTRVQQIGRGMPIRISSERRPTVCNFVVADVDSLTCRKTQSIFFIPVTRRLVFLKTEVTSVKMSRQLLSTAAGAGIGAGAGAGIGAGVDASAKNQVEEGHLLTVVFAMLGGVVGMGVGQGTDFLAGPTIYRAP